MLRDENGVGGAGDVRDGGIVRLAAVFEVFGWWLLFLWDRSVRSRGGCK